MGGATGRWFSTGTPVFSTNKVDRHDTAEILLKEASNIFILLKLFYPEVWVNKSTTTFNRSACTILGR